MSKVYLYEPRYTAGAVGDTSGLRSRREVDEATAKAALADESVLWRHHLQGLHGEAGIKRANKLGLGGILVEYEDTEEHDHFARHWRDLCTGASGVDRMSIADRWDGPGRVRGRSGGIIQSLLTDGEIATLKADKLAVGAAETMREGLARKRASVDARLGCFRNPAQRPGCLANTSSVGGPCYYCPNRKLV